MLGATSCNGRWHHPRVAIEGSKPEPAKEPDVRPETVQAGQCRRVSFPFPAADPGPSTRLLVRGTLPHTGPD
jgi:hypothetical protein